MAIIPGGVRVTGFISPSDSTDQYGTHDSLYGIGGYREVSDIAARDAIPALRRKLGALVYVQSEDKFYYLKGGLDNGYWRETVFIDIDDYQGIKRRIVPFIIGQVVNLGLQSIIIPIPFNATIESITGYTLQPAVDVSTSINIQRMSKVDYDAGSTTWQTLSTPIVFDANKRKANTVTITNGNIYNGDLLVLYVNSFSTNIKGINIELVLID